jgi:hypothetical protein
MSAKKPSATDPITRLERKLQKIKAAHRRKFLNEDILRLEKNGEISYETVRTVAIGDQSVDDPLSRRAHTVGEPNFYPETPDSPKNGQLIEPASGDVSAAAEPDASSQAAAAPQLRDRTEIDEPGFPTAASDGIIIHKADCGGQKISTAASAVSLPPADENADPLEELLARALTKTRRGRPAAFDEHNKGKLVALLSLGMSLRQAASVLGVSHGTIRNTLKADPALAEEITAARFQAQLQPLACVIREARRSWKAATWLLKYLDSKIASHEETPDERRQRQDREAEEFFARAGGTGVKRRAERA